jgi:hypothetical protein
MDETTLRHTLYDHLGSLRLFSNALGLPMYHAERVEYLGELMNTCDSISRDVEMLCDGSDRPTTARESIPRVANFQWRMDDKPFTSA